MIFNIPLARNLGLVLNQQHPYSLHLGGQDIILQVLVEPVEISEAGSGGVSSIQFSFDDPDSSFVIPDGSEIRMWDYTRDLPLFWGWVQSVTYELWSAVGRTIHVTGFGIESLLDTVVVPNLTFANTGPFMHGSDTPGQVFWTQALLQVLVGLTGLRGGTDIRANPTVTAAAPSSLSGPIGGLSDFYATGTDVTQDIVSIALGGQTIRTALDNWRALGIQVTTDTGFVPRPFFLSVDFWGGVRFFEFGGGVTTYLPTDYASLTISDTAGGAVVASSLSWEVDQSPGAIVNAVYVQGAAAASTGWVVGDTTTGRREAYTTTTGTTRDALLSAAQAVMGQISGSAGRGTLTLEDYTPTNVHPGSQLFITDARMGWAAKGFLVTQIDKRFIPGSAYQDWTVSFIDGGGTPTAGRPSSMQAIRSTTRGTLN